MSRDVPGITVREATVADIPEILRQRQRMYEDMHYTDRAALEAASRLSSVYLQKAIPERSFRAWLAFDGARPVAGGAILITAGPAHPDALDCRRALILNVYTEPAYRRRGIARMLMRTLIQWLEREGFPRVTLHASDEGRPLYESLGFEPSNEMRLQLRSGRRD